MTNFKISLKKLPCIVLALLMLSTALVFSGCGETKIDVKGAYLLDVTLSGCNGHGKAELDLHTTNVSAELSKYENDENYLKISTLLYDMTFEFVDKEQNGNLTNDETFDVKAVYDEELAAEIGVVLENTTITCTAKNLPEGVELDAFKDLKVTFSGADGDGYASIDTGDCDKTVRDNIYFTVDGDKYNLKNGDEITVVAESYIDLEEKGYFLKEESKTYTVEGLSGPRTSLEGVDMGTVLTDMKSEINDKIKNDYNVCYYDYTFSSGKKRDISSYEFTYTTQLDLVNYQYVYDPEDLDTNGLIAYYKLTTTFKCKSDQSYVADGATAMKKGDKDTGTTYLAVVSNSLSVDADDKLIDDYIYFTVTNGISIQDIKEDINIGMYSSEYYDKDFKVTTSGEGSTEKSTEKATEKSTDKKSEATEATEKATTKQA